MSITIAFHSAYRQEADYKVFGDGQPYKIIFRYGADGPEGYNRTDPTFYGREIVAGIGILHRESGEMVKPEVLAAFQALWHQDGLRDPSPVTGWFNHDPAVRTWVRISGAYAYEPDLSRKTFDKHFRCYMDPKSGWCCEPIPQKKS